MSYIVVRVGLREEEFRRLNLLLNVSLGIAVLGCDGFDVVFIFDVCGVVLKLAAVRPLIW